ncbi:MAG: hypothetical protein ACTHKJ_08570, partial [Candidatus Nitrosocosmicus sp.]
MENLSHLSPQRVKPSPNQPFHDQAQEQPQPNYENPMHVVSDLLEHFHIAQSIEGARRRVLEAMAYFNLKGHPATNNDIYHRVNKEMTIG